MSFRTSFRFAFGITILGSVFLVSLDAQKAGSPPAGGGTGNTPTAPSLPSKPTSPSPTNPTGQPGQNLPGLDATRRPMFFSGKVVTEEGGPPPDFVNIDLICGAGGARRQGVTDSKGRFSFQLGNNDNINMDASLSGPSSGGMGGAGGFGATNMGMSERQMMGCELHFVLPGFRAPAVSLANRRSLDNPDLGTVILHRLANVEGLTSSATSMFAPKDAKKAYDKARDLLKKNKAGDADRELSKAVELYPKYAAAWFELGRIKQGQKDIEGARNAYQQSIGADAKFVNPYRELAGLAAREKKWDETADTTDRIIRLNPVDFPDAYMFNAIANLNLHKLDAAEKSAREAAKLDNRHQLPQIQHVLGVILANKEDYTGAVENMKAYLEFVPKTADTTLVRQQLADIERLAGQKAQNGQAPKEQ